MRSDDPGELRAHARGDDPPTDDPRWTAVLRRDRSADGQFVYAVTSTGVFCRPSCPSRRPRARSGAVLRHPGGGRARRLPRLPALPSDQPRARALPSPMPLRAASRYLAAHADETVSAGHARAGRAAQPVAPAAGVQARARRVAARVPGGVPRRSVPQRAARRPRRDHRDVRGRLWIAQPHLRVGADRPRHAAGGLPARRRRRARSASRRCAVRLGWLLVAATDKGVCAVKLGDTRDALEADLRREFPSSRDHAEPPRPAPSGSTAIVDRLRGTGRDVMPAARRARHGVSVARVAGAAADSGRRDALLFGRRPRHRPAVGRARRCHAPARPTPSASSCPATGWSPRAAAWAATAGAHAAKNGCWRGETRRESSRPSRPGLESEVKSRVLHDSHAVRRFAVG